MFKKVKKILRFLNNNNILKKRKIFLVKILKKIFTKKIFLFLVMKNCLKQFLKEDNKERGNIIITGTGGDKKKTFNITSSVFILLSTIFKMNIIKYGSKSFTSKVGSIDFLNYFLKKNHVFLKILYSNNIFKNISNILNIRKQIFDKTIFNYIFPLVNVSKSNYHIVGSSSLVLHKILKYKKKKNIMFLSGLDKMDEATIYSSTKVTIFKNNICSYIINNNSIKEKKNNILISTVKESYKKFRNLFYNKSVKKIIIINLFIIIKYLKKNKNIFFLLKSTINIENIDVKFFKRNNK